jgi:hypothetical protein
MKKEYARHLSILEDNYKKAGKKNTAAIEMYRETSYGKRNAGRAKNASLTFLRKMEEHNVSKAYTEKVKARADAKAIETKIAADAAIGAAKKELEDHEGPQDKAVAAPDTTQASTID